MNKILHSQWITKPITNDTKERLWLYLDKGIMNPYRELLLTTHVDSSRNIFLRETHFKQPKRIV